VPTQCSFAFVGTSDCKSGWGVDGGRGSAVILCVVSCLPADGGGSFVVGKVGCGVPKVTYYPVNTANQRQRCGTEIFTAGDFVGELARCNRRSIDRRRLLLALNGTNSRVIAASTGDETMLADVCNAPRCQPMQVGLHASTHNSTQNRPRHQNPETTTTTARNIPVLE
jgi:hypothetical protein